RPPRRREGRRCDGRGHPPHARDRGARPRHPRPAPPRARAAVASAPVRTPLRRTRRRRSIGMRKLVARTAPALALALAASLPACGTRPHAGEPQPALTPATGPMRVFSYQAIDGRPLSTESLTNRVSVIGFLTTYDVHSQAEARLLAQLERYHSPRINVAALM